MLLLVTNKHVQTAYVHNQTFELAEATSFHDAYSGAVVAPTTIRPARNEYLLILQDLLYT